MDALRITTSGEQDALDKLRLSPALPVLPSDFGENAEAAWDHTVAENLSISRSLMIGNAWGKYLDQVEETTGTRPTAPPVPVKGRQSMFPPSIAGSQGVTDIKSVPQSTYINEMMNLKRMFPELEVKGPEDIRADAIAEAARIRGRFEEVRKGADWKGDVGAFTGMIGASVVDPPNLASMFIGAGAASNLLRTIMVEAALGAAVELASQPGIAAWKRELGVEFTAGEAVGNVVGGAVGGGIGGGALKVASMGIGRVLGLWRKARAQGLVAETAETRAAESVLDQVDEVLARAPEQTVEGQAQHVERLKAAEEAIARERAPEPVEPVVEPPKPVRRGALPPSLKPPGRKPQTLTAWVRRQGGLKEEGGELAAIGLTARTRPGAVSSNGMSFDEAARRSWEHGFFSERPEPPSENEFLDMLGEDFAGRHQYAGDEFELLDEWQYHDQRWREIDQADIDPRGRTDAEIDAMLMARYRRATPDEAAVVVSDVTGAKTDLDAVTFGEVNRLLDDFGDFEIPLDVIVEDGTLKPFLRSARELMQEADDEIAAVEAFRACAIGRG